MDPSADLHAIEVLRDWLAALRVYHHESQEALAAVALEIQRMPSWIEESLDEWKRRIRKAEDRVFQAKMELHQRQYPDFSGRVPDTSQEEKALRRAEAEREYAREQVQVCRRWLQQFNTLVGEIFDGPSRRMVSFLESDLPKALARLDGQLAALDRYTQTPDRAS